MDRCRRLVDYFVEVVAEPADAATLAEEHESFARRVVNRIPRADHADFPLPDGVPYFCIPESVAFANPCEYERRPIFFSFSLTSGDGSRAYGLALHYFEAFATPGAEWRPRVFCLISHHPFFSLFKEVVSWVYRNRSQTSELLVAQTKIANACLDRSWFVSPRNSLQHGRRSLTRSIPNNFESTGRPSSSSLSQRDSEFLVSTGAPSTESLSAEQVNELLLQLVNSAQAPRSGGILELQIEGQDFFKYHLQRGKATHVDDYCFQMLFQCLGLKNVVYVLNCMLLEQRILVHSNVSGAAGCFGATSLCEALCALLFPFAWEHVYIPFLPVKLIEYLHAPVPYFIGLHTSSLATRVGSEIFASCVVVHLDKDKVVSPIFSRIDGSPLDFKLARLPTREVDAVLRSLSDVVPRPISANQGTFSAKDIDPSSPLSVAAVPQDKYTGEPSSAADCEVELTFGDGPFGITFESTHLRLLAVSNFEHGRQPGASAVVKALPRLPNGLPGPAERSGLISAGSFLIGINGESTLDLTFPETINRLRTEKRPIRLRFLNSDLPYENACRFAERLQALSLVSALQADRSNMLLPWVDAVRSAFAHMFTSIFRDYQKFISIKHTDRPNDSSNFRLRAHTNKRRRSSTLSLSVAFDHAAYVESSPMQIRDFVRDFAQTQCFSGFIDDSVLGRISHSIAFPHIELFKHCVHLIHEITPIKLAIDLLFERDSMPVEIVKLNLVSSAMRESDPMTDFVERVDNVTTYSSSSFQGNPVERQHSTSTRQVEIKICGSPSSADVVLGPAISSPECDDMCDIETSSGVPSTIGSSPSCS
ncbi:Denn domain-containing protein 5b, partial [Globisporangium splendens]